MRGRRKNNVGRLLLGNRLPPPRANYGQRPDGPWIFGIVWLKNDGQ